MVGNYKVPSRSSFSRCCPHPCWQINSKNTVMEDSPGCSQPAGLPLAPSICTEKELASGSREGDQDLSSPSKSSLWSSFIASTFSVFESRSDTSKSSGTSGWTEAVRRAVTSGPMRRFQERILGSKWTGPSGSSSEIWLLGKCYKISSEESTNSSTSPGYAEFLDDFSSRLWMTYRKGFEPIGESKIISDVGWGCMLRSGQMLVAQALLFHYLGRSWRRSTKQPLNREYIEIVQRFGDSESEACPFSIHNLLEAGKNYGLAAGSWLGPSAMCYSWQALARAAKESCMTGKSQVGFPMAIYVVSGEECGGGAPSICIEDAARLCSEGSNGKGENQVPLLILVPLLLGMDKINPRYIPSLLSTFTFPQSLGMVGGKPGASTYIAGVQDDQALYLDPHDVQQVVEIAPENMEVDTSSYHCSVVRSMPLSEIDPSLAIGFYCRNRDDFDDLCARASDLANQANGAPIFTVTQSTKSKESDALILERVESIMESQDTLTLENDHATSPASSEDEWQLVTMVQ